MAQLLKSNRDETGAAPRKVRSLSDLATGEQGLVSALRGGKDFTCRMVTLGFTIGSTVTVVQNYGRGPMIVAIRDTQIALGRGEAIKVLVAVK